MHQPGYALGCKEDKVMCFVFEKAPSMVGAIELFIKEQEKKAKV